MYKLWNADSTFRMFAFVRIFLSVAGLARCSLCRVTLLRNIGTCTRRDQQSGFRPPRNSSDIQQLSG